jgi:hypothetical protein
LASSTCWCNAVENKASYEELTAAHTVVTGLEGPMVEGELRSSLDIGRATSDKLVRCSLLVLVAHGATFDAVLACDRC